MNSSHCSRYPEAGGAFKVQIYSPYLVVNKMGIPFGVMAVRSSRPGAPHAVAGDTRDGLFSPGLGSGGVLTIPQRYYPSQPHSVSKNSRSLYS